MSTTTTAGSPARRNRLLHGGLWAAAALGYGVGIAAERGLLAVAAFAGFGIAAIGFRSTRGEPLYDERDDRLLQEASARTVRAVGLVSAVLFPTLVVLDALGRWSWTPFMAGVGTAVAVVYLVYFGMNAAVRVR
ncbi:MAG: DUF2178 domain-containing protein [Halolamina sp.]